jgi:hypothetical protein
MRLTTSRLTFCCLPLYLAVCVIWSAYAESPAPIDQVAPVEDITHEIDRVVARLEELLATAESFEAAKETEVPQNFGTLACLAQALAEHPNGEAAYDAAVLRDAALRYTLESTYEEAQQAFASRISVPENAETLHPWNELTDRHAMMEEINARNAAIARILRRPQATPDNISNASTIAILALAMEADTGFVEGDEEKTALWKELSAEYRNHMIALADAIRTEAGAAVVREHFTAANAACDRCHVEIRDVE